MHVCLIAVEIFTWGKYGGFCRATRMIGRELIKRGIQVTAVIPCRENQQSVEYPDGIKVLGFQTSEIPEVPNLIRAIDADIYHSQEPCLGTYLVIRAMPEKKHIVTFRDPRIAHDWRTEFRLPSLHPAQVFANWLYEDNPLVTRAVQQSDGWYASVKILIPKAKRKYKLASDPEFLPTPVEIPSDFQKPTNPTVWFISRWDNRKRPKMFFELTRSFPDVRFIATGKSRNHRWDTCLRDTYGKLPNIEMPGFIDQFEDRTFTDILGQS